MTRRDFLRSLGVALVAPAVIVRAISEPPLKQWRNAYLNEWWSRHCDTPDWKRHYAEQRAAELSGCQGHYLRFANGSRIACDHEAGRLLQYDAKLRGWHNAHWQVEAANREIGA